MIQSLKSIDDINSFFGKYGFVVVDECHHLPAFTFEDCIKKAPVRHMLGLTATPYRRDELENIVTMQCGPIRCAIEDAASELSLRLNVRETSFEFSNEESSTIHDIFRALVNDEARNLLIEEDVLSALRVGRRCLILSQWKEHCRLLAESLAGEGVRLLYHNNLQRKYGNQSLTPSPDASNSDSAPPFPRLSQSPMPTNAVNKYHFFY